MELKIDGRGRREYQKRVIKFGKKIIEIYKSIDKLNDTWELKKILVNRKRDLKK